MPSLVHAGAGLLLLASVACGSGRSIEETVEAAQELLIRGDFAGTLSVIDQASPSAKTSPGSLWQLALLRADVLLERGDTADAMSLLETLREGEAPTRALLGRRTFLVGKAERNQRNYEAALATLRRARESSSGEPRVTLAADWLTGQVHVRLGRWQEGERILVEVASRAARLPDRHQEALAYLDLGMSRLVRSRYDEALLWFERVLTFSDLEESALFGKALNNAGICYSRLGLFEKASKVQRDAVELQARHGRSRELSEALGSLGVTHGLQGDHKAALPILSQAKDVAQKNGDTGDAALWASNIATAHALLGEWDDAERLNAESRKLGGGSSRVKPVYNTLTDGEIALGRGDVVRARDLYTSALSASEGAPAVTWAAEAGLAQVALAQHAPDEAARHYESALATVERTRSELLKADYRLSFLTQLIAFYRSYVDALINQGQSHRAMEIADSSRGRVLAERQRVAAPARATAASFQHVAARTKTTFLSYWLAPTRSSLWVIDGKSIRRVDLPPASEIEAAVKEYRALIDNSMANPIDKAGTAGDRLYQMLVAPAKLPRNASVVIVPDGALHSINFETLPVDGPSRHYWIEDVQVQIAPSLAMLTAETGQKGDGRLLLIGNPKPREPDFPALRFAQEEMTHIIRHFPQERVTSKFGDDATPDMYQKAALDRFSMIHFTAHAVANVESPLDSAVVLSGPDTAYKLYARDVADQPLKADLVTVSACRSAGERAYSGEGLVGFAWAFLRAGARRVVAGLWDVDDKSTAQLMVSLYGGVAAGQPPAAALRAAKLELIKQGGQLARPYYWGPFQLFTVTP